MAGILRDAWKTLRGAVVASTAIVTVGAVAHQAEADKIVTQTTPKAFERFILSRPPCVMNRIPTISGGIYDYSSRGLGWDRELGCI